MAKKSELLTKKWSELTKKEQRQFKSKEGFQRRKQNQPTTTPTPTPNKPKKAAALAIQQDRGKLKPRDVTRIAKQTGLTSKQISKIASRQGKDQDSATTSTSERQKRSDLTEGMGIRGALRALTSDGKLGDKDISFLAKNYPGFKASDAKTFLGRKRNQDIRGPKSTIKTTIRSSRGKDTGNGNGTRNGNGKDTDTDPFEDIEFPSGKSGKEFRKYKPQGKDIREAAEADLAAKMKESFKPEVLGKAKSAKDKFLTGRDKRQHRIDKIGKVEKPKFETYKDKVKDIRKGKGEAAKYAYSTRFKNLGEQLGIGYTRKERRIRTKKRLRKLNLGTQGAYETTAKSRKRRRESGKQIIASMGIS